MKLALAAVLLATVTAKPADVCIAQADCVDFSVEKIDEAVSPSRRNTVPPTVPTHMHHHISPHFDDFAELRRHLPLQDLFHD